MKKKTIITLFIVSIVLITAAIILLTKNKELAKNKIEILDATYSCENIPEVFYEDEKYIYSFPCPKSNSIFVKFSNGNKLLITTALEEKKITIEELEKAGLVMTKEEK